jgi:hypothetical protein
LHYLRKQADRSAAKKENVMKRIQLLVCAVLVCIASSAFAQTPSVPIPPPNVDQSRARLTDALAKDAASAEKLQLELGPALKLPAGSLNGNTSYEEIRSCGFYPQETRLECVVEIKQQGGYGGPIGSLGTFEYVAFYVDFGGGWVYVGSGIVHITDGSAKTNFAVYRDWNPPGGLRTSNGGASTTTVTSGPILKVRARLQFGSPVASAISPIIFGNTFDFAIRMMPIR